MQVLNFYSTIFADELKRGRKTATIRLGDKSGKYRKNQAVLVTIGYQYSPRERIFEAVIDQVEVMKVADLSPRDIKHDNPEFRRHEELINFLEQIYGRSVSMQDTVTVVRFSQILDKPTAMTEAMKGFGGAQNSEARRPLAQRPGPLGTVSAERDPGSLARRVPADPLPHGPDLLYIERAVGTLPPRVPRGRGSLKRGCEPPVAFSRWRFFDMNLKPLGDRLIVRAIEEEETTASGLVLPDTAKEKPQKGKVLAVGDGKLDDSGKRIPLDVSEGDEVLYSKYGGTEIKLDGEDLLVLRESDVLAKVA